MKNLAITIIFLLLAGYGYVQAETNYTAKGTDNSICISTLAGATVEFWHGTNMMEPDLTAYIFYYSLDEGQTWTKLSVTSTVSIDVPQSGKVYLRGNNHSFCRYYDETYASNFQIHVSWRYTLSGKLSSIIQPTEEDIAYAQNLFFNDKKISDASGLILDTPILEKCFYNMFCYCEYLTTAPEIPSTTLARYCYSGMFVGCSSLKEAPKLPATELANGCYLAMFFQCKSLKAAPELPAMTLAPGCYSNMFGSCTSLTEAPSLPATSVAPQCYSSMFEGCSSIVTAPELPATELKDANRCYEYMFSNCTSLIAAPELPATELANYCYEYMFQSCVSLKEVPKILPAKTILAGCYAFMFAYCTSLETAPELPAEKLPYNSNDDWACYCSMFAYDTSLTYASISALSSEINLATLCMFTGCTHILKAGEAKVDVAVGSEDAWHSYHSIPYENLNAVIGDGIDNVKTTQTSTEIYDIQGRRLNAVPENGIYIKNGRKVIVSEK